MRYLSGQEKEQAVHYFQEAEKIARQATCFRSRCGSVIVKDGLIIGSGFNSPPLHKTLDHCLKDSLPKDFKSDKTCCLHAEQRAIMDALRHHSDKIIGSRIYFTRLDEKGLAKKSGKPYCTICSKMSLDAGIAEFAL